MHAEKTVQAAEDQHLHGGHRSDQRAAKRIINLKVPLLTGDEHGQWWVEFNDTINWRKKEDDQAEIAREYHIKKDFANISPPPHDFFNIAP